VIPPGQDGASLEAEAISFTYPSAERAALHEVSLNLEPGQLGCLMGRTGAGKSTLSLCLNGIIPAMQAGEFKGIVRIGADSISAQPVHEIARRVGLLFQDFETQLLCSDVESEVAFGLENAQMPREQMQQRVTEMLELVGLNDLRGRDPATLSGGQKQRLALAAVLAPAPQVIILDEPTTDLDPLGKRELMEVCAQLRDDGITMLMADHEAGRAIGADHLTVLDEGEVAFAGPGDELLSDPDRLRELGTRPLEMPALFAALGLAERPLTPERAAAILSARGWRVDEEAYARLADEDARTDDLGHTLISADEVSYAYPEGGAQALRGVSLRIREGEFVAILGENGSGKTTLAKHLNGLLRPDAGQVTVCGMHTRGARPRQLAHEVGYLFQNPDHQIFAGRVDEEIAFGPRNLGVSEAELRSRVRQVLALVNLEGYEGKDPFVLTKGERQRVALASVLAARPRIIVFDEPTTGLDGPEQEQMMRLLRGLNEAGQTIIFITHCTWAAAEYARRAIVMDEGRIVADVTPRELFGDAGLLAETGQVPPAVAQFSQALDGKALLSIREALRCLRAPTAEGEG